MKTIPLRQLIKDIETIAPKINSIKDDDETKIHLSVVIDTHSIRGRGSGRRRRNKKPTA